MNAHTTIKKFLNRYGCTLVRLDGVSAKGICTRIDSTTTEVENLSFDRLGYAVKREFLLITDKDSDLLQVGSQLLVNQRRLQIISVDDTCYQDEPLCKRGYAFEVREVF